MSHFLKSTPIESLSHRSVMIDDDDTEEDDDNDNEENDYLRTL